MHDINSLEQRGIPGLFVASSEFVEAAAAQGRAIGFDPAVVYVPHPIQDRTVGELRAIAKTAVFDVIAKIEVG